MRLFKSNSRFWASCWIFAATLIAVDSPPGLAARSAEQQRTEIPGGKVPHVSANVALSSLMALSDGHLQKIADSLKLLAASEAAKSGDWEKIRAPLQEAKKMNVEANLWFALRDGTYWSLASGKASEKLSDRPYFPKLMAGKPTIGDLVVSKSTGKSSGIVAVPVHGKDGTVMSALGASVYLDKLSGRLNEEMGLDSTMIYYSFNDKPLVGLNWDPSLIFADPYKLGPELTKVFHDMLTKDQGIETYTFRGKQRTVIFRKSKVTGWWYAFGVTPEGREKRAAKASKSPE